MIGEKDVLIGVHNDIALPVVVFTAVAACFFVGIFQIAGGLWLTLHNHVWADVAEYALVTFIVECKAVVNINASFPHAGHTLNALDA